MAQPMTPAERTRLYRQRKAAGLTRLEVWVDEADVSAKLTALRYLHRDRADDPAAMADAVVALLASLQIDPSGRA